MLPDASHESFLLGIRDPDHTHWKSSERSRIHSTRYHAPFPPGRGINSTPRCGCLERTASIQPSDNDMTTAHHRTHTSFASHTAKPQEKNIACQRRKIIFRRGTSWIGSLPTPLYTGDGSYTYVYPFIPETARWRSFIPTHHHRRHHDPRCGSMAVAELDLIEHSLSSRTADRRFIIEVLSKTHNIPRRANGTEAFFQLSSTIHWASTDVTM